MPKEWEALWQAHGDVDVDVGGGIIPLSALMSCASQSESA